MMLTVAEHYFFGTVRKVIDGKVVLYAVEDVTEVSGCSRQKADKYIRAYYACDAPKLWGGTNRISLCCIEDTERVIHHGSLSRRNKQKLLHWLIETEGKKNIVDYGRDSLFLSIGEFTVDKKFLLFDEDRKKEA